MLLDATGIPLESRRTVHGNRGFERLVGGVLGVMPILRGRPWQRVLQLHLGADCLAGAEVPGCYCDFVTVTPGDLRGFVPVGVAYLDVRRATEAPAKIWRQTVIVIGRPDPNIDVARGLNLIDWLDRSELP